jgi:dTDP-4-dehydrorhamnose reductase
VRLFVVGIHGQIARSLREAAALEPDIMLECGSRPNVDILRADLIEKALRAFAPDVVVNPAAYTAVDRAEDERDIALAINRDGARIVASAAARLGVPIVHLSTDYVFDGRKQGSYVETDAVAPQGVYGSSKLAGEYAVAEANEHHIILRTSWVYAPFGNNFVRTMMRLSTDHDTIRVVDDQVGCPTFAPDIANAILTIARKTKRGWNKDFAGVTHLAGPDEVTWCEFARRIMRVLERNGERSAAVEGIASAAYPTAAVRPANSRLCCARLASIFDIRMPPLEWSLEQCIERLLGART